MAGAPAPFSYRISNHDATYIKRVAFLLDLFGVIPLIGDVGKQFGWFYLNRFFKKRNVNFIQKQFTPGKTAKKIFGELIGVFILYWPGMTLAVRETLRDAYQEDDKRSSEENKQSQQYQRAEYEQRYKQQLVEEEEMEEQSRSESESEDDSRDISSSSQEISQSDGDELTPALEREDETKDALDDQEDFSSADAYETPDSDSVDRPFRRRASYRERNEQPTEARRRRRQDRRRARRGVSSANTSATTEQALNKQENVALDADTLMLNQVDQSSSPETLVPPLTSSTVLIPPQETHDNEEGTLLDEGELTPSLEEPQITVTPYVFPGEEDVIRDPSFQKIYQDILNQLEDQKSSILTLPEDEIGDVVSSLSVQQYTDLYPEQAKQARNKGWRDFISQSNGRRLLRQFRRRESSFEDQSPSLYNPLPQQNTVSNNSFSASPRQEIDVRDLGINSFTRSSTTDTSAQQSRNRITTPSTTPQITQSNEKAQSPSPNTASENGIPDPFEDIEPSFSHYEKYLNDDKEGEDTFKDERENDGENITPNSNISPPFISTLQPSISNISKSRYQQQQQETIPGKSSLSSNIPTLTEEQILEQAREQKAVNDYQEVIALKQRGVLVSENIELFDTAFTSNIFPANVRFSPQFQAIKRVFEPSARATELEKFKAISELKKNPLIEQKLHEYETIIRDHYNKGQLKGVRNLRRVAEARSFWRNWNSKKPNDTPPS